MTEMSSGQKKFCISGAVILLALAVRLVPAWSALDFPERITRPDTMTYLAPAQALLEGRFSGTGRAGCSTSTDTPFPAAAAVSGHCPPGTASPAGAGPR